MKDTRTWFDFQYQMIHHTKHGVDGFDKHPL